MARTNPFTTAAAIALMSDLGRKYSLNNATVAYWVGQFETVGYDNTMPRLFESLRLEDHARVARESARDAKRRPSRKP